MNTVYLTWALWVVAGGHTNGVAYIAQPQPVAYFHTKAGCEDVRKYVEALSGERRRPMQCIQADYRLPHAMF